VKVLVRACLLLLPLPSTAQEFEKTVSPFLQTYCVSCHGEKKAKGEIRLDRLGASMAGEAEAGLWHRVLESLKFGEMPSDKAEKFPTMREARAVQAWIASQLSQRGHAPEDKSRSEGYGNLVSHDLLFGKESRNDKIDVAARLWRISPKALISQVVREMDVNSGLWQLDDFRFGRQVKAKFDFDVNTNPFALDKPHGKFRDFKGKYLFNSMMAAQLTELALGASEKLVADELPAIARESSSGQALEVIYRRSLQGHFRRVLRRAPAEEELSSLVALAKRVDEELGEGQGLAAAYSAVILQPGSIFRLEEAGGVSEGGLRELSRSTLAHSLSHALTDLPPSRELVERMTRDGRPTSEVLALEARRLFTENPLSQRRALQFFQEYFDYEKAKDIFKMAEGRVHWAPAYVADLDLLISKVLEKDQHVFRTLLTTNEYRLRLSNSFANASPLAYNLPPDVKRSGEVIRMPRDQRMGVLTHPAWLVAHSGNFDNDPIRRGLWIRRKLLGGMVPDIPVSVDAKLPDEPEWSLRRRLEITNADQCYKCHSKMNDLGLPFERFSHLGRYRRLELGQEVNTRGAITRSGDTSIDGPVDTPFEMIAKLASSKRVEQVFTRHVFRFFMGRNEALGDAATLQDAHRAYRESGGSFQALVISLLSSDSFICRVSASGGK